MTFPHSLILALYQNGKRNLLDLVVASAIHTLPPGIPATRGTLRNHLRTRYHLAVRYDSLRSALDRSVEDGLLLETRPQGPGTRIHYTLAPHLLTQTAA